MNTKFLWVVTLLVAVQVSLATGQNPPTLTSDPQALTIAGAAIAALTHGTATTDVTITGTGTWIVGPDSESGPATLMSKGLGESRIDLQLSSGARSEVRNNSAGFPQGDWITSDGAYHPMALHNCWIDPSWFFPALSSLAGTANPAVVLRYVGLESLGGTSVHHLRSLEQISQPKPKSTALIERLSTIDYYVDSASLLPVAITFNLHPDDDAGRDVPVQVLFLRYQTVNGFQVPFHIQKYMNGTLLFDFTASSFAVNTGIADAVFAVQ